MLHEELNQGFHCFELFPLGENRCAGTIKMLRCSCVLVNPLES